MTPLVEGGESGKDNFNANLSKRCLAELRLRWDMMP